MHLSHPILWEAGVPGEVMAELMGEVEVVPGEVTTELMGVVAAVGALEPNPFRSLVNLRHYCDH